MPVTVCSTTTITDMSRVPRSPSLLNRSPVIQSRVRRSYDFDGDKPSNEHTTIFVKPRSRSNSNTVLRRNNKQSILAHTLGVVWEFIRTIRYNYVLYSTICVCCLAVGLYLLYFPYYPGWQVPPGRGPKVHHYSVVESTYQPLTGDSDIAPNNLLVLTACSSNHYQSLQYMLYSLREFNTQVVLYDLGLLPSQRLELIQWPNLIIHEFPYDQYPPHVDVKVQAGAYAWKPIIINNHMSNMLLNTHTRQPTNILWIDAGAYFLDISLIQQCIQGSNQGVYIGASYGVVAQKSSPLMYQYLGEDYTLYADKVNCEAGIVGFQLRQDVYDKIIEPWYKCALDVDCIAPPGTSRKNHRQDQSVLTYLLHKNNMEIIPFAERTYRYDAVKTKCDRSMYRWFPTYPSLQAYAYLCLF